MCNFATNPARQPRQRQSQQASPKHLFILPVSLRNGPGQHKPANQLSGYICGAVTAGETRIKVQAWPLIEGRRIIFRGHRARLCLSVTRLSYGAHHLVKSVEPAH